MQEVVEQNTFTVLGFDGDELLGEGDLNYSSADWTRHLGEIRLLLSPPLADAASDASWPRKSTPSPNCSNCNS